MEENTVAVETQPEVTTEAPEVEAETNQSTEVEQTEAPEMFKYKYNHEEKEIPIDEARQLVQKGANYDKIKAKLDELESSPSLGFVKRQAEKYNMSVDEYLDAVAKEERAAEIKKIADAEGVTNQVAEKLYKATKLEEKAVSDAKAAKQKEQQDKYMQEFVKQYPDVKEVSQDVWDRFNKGDISLVDAYEQANMKSEIASLRDELAKYKQQEEVENKNTENAESSTGSVTGNGSSEQFYTEDQMRNMTREEILKDYDKVIASRKHWRK